jgi:hypothetical protein
MHKGRDGYDAGVEDVEEILSHFERRRIIKVSDGLRWEDNIADHLPHQVNIPKTRRTYCKGRDCKKHTNHKVTQYKAGKVHIHPIPRCSDWI